MINEYNKCGDPERLASLAATRNSKIVRYMATCFCQQHLLHCIYLMCKTKSLFIEQEIAILHSLIQGCV